MDDLLQEFHRSLGRMIGWEAWDERSSPRHDSCRLWRKSKTTSSRLIRASDSWGPRKPSRQSGADRLVDRGEVDRQHMTARASRYWPSLPLLRPLHKFPSTSTGEPGRGKVKTEKTGSGRMRGAILKHIR
ncbi:hypothetical protein BDW71DRAFT_54883 [Aspergillus fruticulosus]